MIWFFWRIGFPVLVLASGLAHWGQPLMVMAVFISKLIVSIGSSAKLFIGPLVRFVIPLMSHARVMFAVVRSVASPSHTSYWIGVIGFWSLVP
jgi:hypothetical protein